MKWSKTFWTDMAVFEPLKWNTNPQQVFVVPFLDSKTLAKLMSSPLIQPDDSMMFWDVQKASESIRSKFSAINPDAIVYPNNYEGELVGRKFLRQCLSNWSNQTRILFFCNSDYSNRHFAELKSEFALPHNFEFWHTNLSASSRTKYERVAPCFRHLPLNHVQASWHQANKRLSFCGCPYTHPLRGMVVTQLLERMQSVVPDFVIRQFFHAHSDARMKIQNASEFVANLYRCTYALCVRGAGNFSYRFCEALQAGRVPVVVESDNALPLDHIPEVKALYDDPSTCIWIKEGNNLVNDPQKLVKTIEDAINQHYQAYSENIYSIHRRIADIGKWMTPVGLIRSVLGVETTSQEILPTVRP